MITELELRAAIKNPANARVSEKHPYPFYGKKGSGANKSINFETRYTYPKGGKQRTTSVGTYPKDSIKVIRERVKVVHDLVANGKDPKLGKRRQAYTVALDGSFNTYCEKWLSSEFNGRQEKYRRRVHRNLSAICKELGAFQIAEISAQDLIEAIRKQIKSPHEQSRVVRHLDGVFRYADIIADTRRNPAHTIKEKFPEPKPKSRPAIIDEAPFIRMIRDVLEHPGKPQTQILFPVTLLTFARIGELIPGRWDEIDWKERIWHIPNNRCADGENRIKTHKNQTVADPHDIYLTDQLLVLLQNLSQITGDNEYMFPRLSTKTKNPFMHRETLQKRINGTKNGAWKGVQCEHGFRSNVSTWATKNFKDMPYRKEAIALASGREMDGVEYVYNRHGYWQEQCEIWQLWANYIESILPYPIEEIGVRASD
jgi:integrase